MAITEKQFISGVRAVLSPSRAIDDLAHLKGRASAMREVKQAFSARGRQLFVHGFRGVGKTSVAMTAAAALGDGYRPILVHCSSESTFYSIIHDLVAKAIGSDPFLTSKTTSDKGEVKGNILAASGSASTTETKSYAGVPTPRTLNEAAALIRAVVNREGLNCIFIIDEFDILKDKLSHELFGSFIKLLADEGVDAKFIFCGVAEDLDQLFHAHQSTYRYFHPLKLERLPLDPCIQIIRDAETRLGIEVEHNSKMRIVQISDGFPYFIHLITECLFWEWFVDTGGGVSKTSPDHYERALAKACTAAEPELRSGYDAVSKKHALDGQLLIWAVADGSELSKQIETVWKDFQRVYDQVNFRLKPEKMLNRGQMSSRLAQFRSPAYQQILTSKTRSWYEFTEKRMRGYARLRAAASGVDLRPDHPLAIGTSK